MIRIEAPATPAIREAVAGGKRFMSVEFVSLEERTTAGGIREIVRALVPDVALVTDPEYGQTAAELRQRGAFITSIATDTEMDCRCSGTLAEDNVYEVSFSPGSFDDLLRDVRSGGRNVSAISRGAGDVVADTRTGSLRLRRTDDGGLGIGIDPLDTLAGRSTRELIEAGVAVLARPVLSDESGFEVEGNVARISEAVFSYILVKPTDREGGQQPLRPARASRRREQRGAPSVEPSKPPEATRRRLWL
ncbi:MAG: hypothetical protein F4Y94_05440 [Chloroflexi bacterium]|nr:hypothetical protein [Chloroflexota bacterium]